jgi:putative transposase
MDTLHQGNKYRLYPDKDTIPKIENMIGNNRWLWNHLKDWNDDHYKETGMFLSYNEMAMKLPDLKKEKDREWLGLYSFSQSLQQVCRQFRTALDRFRDSGFDFPKFKAKHYSEVGVVFPQKWQLKKDQVYLPKLGWIRFIKHRPINGKIKHVTLTKDGNQYYISFCTEYEAPIEVLPDQVGEKTISELVNNNSMVGLDVGTVRLATTSDNEIFPKLGDKQLDIQIKEKQRALARKSVFKDAKTPAQAKKIAKKLKNGEIKQSNNYNKERKVLTKLQRKRRFKRKNDLHQISASLVNRYDVIVVEDLNVKGMTKQVKRHEDGSDRKGVATKSGLNREILAQGWGMLFLFLAYKCIKLGKTFLKVDPKYTSQTCSWCGYQAKENRESQAEFHCKKCGTHLNADHNASLNILERGKNSLLLGARQG